MSDEKPTMQNIQVGDVIGNSEHSGKYPIVKISKNRKWYTTDTSGSEVHQFKDFCHYEFFISRAKEEKKPMGTAIISINWEERKIEVKQWP